MSRGGNARLRGRPSLRACALVFVLLLQACGGSSLDETSSDEDLAAGPKRQAALSAASPALKLGATIPARYGCVEDANWLPLHWARVPKDTTEIAVGTTIIGLENNEGGVTSTSFGGWVIGGLDRDRRGLPAGGLPGGAFAVDYPSTTECPSRNEGSLIIFTVYALGADQRLNRGSNLTETSVALKVHALAMGAVVARYGARTG